MISRFKEYFITKGWFHLCLVTCSAVFLFPFIWMIASSLKTDDEALDGNFLPSLPEFRAVSPYPRVLEETEQPTACAEQVWQVSREALLSVARQKISDYPLKPRVLGEGYPRDKALEYAAVYLFNRGVERMPLKVWSEGDDAIKEAFLLALQSSPGGEEKEIERALNRSQSRFLLNSVKLRTRRGQVIYHDDLKQSSTKGDLSAWQYSENGRLEYDSDGKLVLNYEFNKDDSREPVVLRYKMRVKENPAKLHRVIVALDFDDSWHQLDAELVVNGERYIGQRTTWLAQNRPSALTLQLPGDEGVNWGKRNWVEMKKENGGDVTPADQAEIEVILTMHPSSTSMARFGKAKRNYDRVLLSMPFWNYVINSALITILIILGSVLSASFIAYAFARLKWPGRSIAFLILLSTMMLPPQVTMIPQFLIWREVGWYNTLNPIWVPAWFGSAFFIFLMVQQMKGIPRDLEEAAEVDGMNRLQIWWYVIVPLVRPGMAAIAIMAFMAAWNEFMAPLIYLRDMGRFPLSVGIYAMGVDDTMNNDMALIMAGNLLMTFPVMVIFFIFQRYFVQGVASSGVKG